MGAGYGYRIGYNFYAKPSHLKRIRRLKEYIKELKRAKRQHKKLRKHINYTINRDNSSLANEKVAEVNQPLLNQDMENARSLTDEETFRVDFKAINKGSEIEKLLM